MGKSAVVFRGVLVVVDGSRKTNCPFIVRVSPRLLTGIGHSVSVGIDKEVGITITMDNP